MKINGRSQCNQRPGEKRGPGTIAGRRWLSVPLLVLVSIGSHFEAAPGRTSPAGESRESLDYFIIVTGSELLRGVYADQHTQFITRALGPLGYRCLGSMSIGDVQTDLNEALDFARGKAPLVLTTGGLGPTSQDITRKVLSDYTRITLKEHPGALTDLKRRYGGVQGVLRPVLRGQALAPEKGTYLPNPNGTAVGLVFDDGQRVIAALPGPPRELRPMVRNELVPYLSDRFGLRKVGHSLTMRFAGIGQSSIDRAIRDHLKLPGDLAVWSSFNSNRVDITFSFPGNSPQELERLRSLQGDLLEHIGEYMYSDTGASLEDRIWQLLQRREASLVLGEIASGGAVSSSLLAAQVDSTPFAGAYAAGSSQALSRLFGGGGGSDSASSPERIVSLLAREAAEKEKGAWALVVGPVDLDEKEAASVWIAAGSVRTGFASRRINVRKGRRLRRDRLVTHALDLLRRELSKESGLAP